MSRALAFVRFWYDFIVGDDWHIAIAVVAGIGVTAALARAGTHAWWLLAVVALAMLGLSTWRASRQDRGH